MPISRIGRPRVAVTMGDPSGIGPEVILKALASQRVARLADFFVVGDLNVLTRTSHSLGLTKIPSTIDLSNVCAKTFSYGKRAASYGKASIEYLDLALNMIKTGQADALVTAPLNKASVQDAGYTSFTGHTEYLAKKFRTDNFAMMFVGKGLKVTLATRHISISQVSEKLTIDAVYRAIMLTAYGLKEHFMIKRPIIGICGLNPHAGEAGIIGREEARIISPAIKKATRSISGIVGPLPADVLFYKAFNGKYDAVVAMYHDQGLAPFKMLYFQSGVNMTLGLPFVRTSPDHGTGFDIAGEMRSDYTSMAEALMLAARLASRKGR